MNVYKPSHLISFFLAFCTAALIAALTPANLQAQTDEVRYFPETGHTVRGEFIDFYNQHGGLRVFGYPITEMFSWNGRTVQYFQRARLELHPDKPTGERVQLGALGEELGRSSAAQSARGPNTYFQRYFPETGHTVAYAFLDFFDSNGGLSTFGYPISEYGSENGSSRIVQYFQHARMEWYPELAAAQRVQLADLGSIHFDQLAAQGKVDPALKKPVPPPGQIGNVPLSLKVSAMVGHAVISPRRPQTLYVYVTDQKNMPVKGAQVKFTMRDTSGAKAVDLSPTDSNGFTSYQFDLAGLRPAQTVFVEVTADSNSITSQDQTSFFTWF
jgi:hypothetical protein